MEVEPSQNSEPLRWDGATEAAAGLAVAETVVSPEAPEFLPASGSRTPIRIIEHQALTKQEKAKAANRTLVFNFNSEGATFHGSFKGGQFSSLPQEVKLLIAFGQAAHQGYKGSSAFKDEEHRRNYALRLVNKGIDDPQNRLDDDDLQELVDEAVDRGALANTKDGIRVTAFGIDLLRSNKAIKQASSRSYSNDAHR